MRIKFDILCPRCGSVTSTEGVSAEVLQEIVKAHVCPDGERFTTNEPTERRVAGLGERLAFVEFDPNTALLYKD